MEKIMITIILVNIEIMIIQIMILLGLKTRCIYSAVTENFKISP